MDFVYVSDDANARAVAVSARSLVRHNPTAVVHVLAQGWSNLNKKRLKDAIESSSAAIIEVSADGLPPGQDHISSAMYLKLLIPDLLATVTRCVYMDADTLVRASIDELFESLSTDATTAGVPDSEIPRIGFAPGIRNWREEGINPQAGYINSGVLVLDLERWRRDDLARRMLAWRKRNPESWGDNDAICAVLNGDFALLAPRFNATVHMMRPASSVYGHMDAVTVDEARADPAIVHFTGAIKPWHRNARLPFLEEWRSVAAEVRWTTFEHSFTLRRRFERRLASLLRLSR